LLIVATISVLTISWGFDGYSEMPEALMGMKSLSKSKFRMAFNPSKG
jgi:hypothetical protein